MTEEQILHPGAIALVTGASAGIGRAVAERLLDRGLRVICAARRKKPLVEAFSGRGDSALCAPLDVKDAAAVAGLIGGLPAEWRDIDVLIANAGSDIGGRKLFHEGDIEDWAGTVETNVTGPMRVCHAVLPGMLRRGRGHVVTLGSIAGIQTYKSGSVYASTKHAVRAFTDSLRKDYRTDPIRITEIQPGLVRTGFAEARLRGDARAAAEFYESFPASLEAEDVAAAILYALEQPPQVNVASITVVPTGDK